MVYLWAMIISKLMLFSDQYAKHRKIVSKQLILVENASVTGHIADNC